jgi:hypothetical protein
VKIAFDENMPGSVVKTLQTIGEQRGFRRHFKGVQLVGAKQYAPAPADLDYRKNDDAPWLKRYKADRGKVVISGDVSMMDKPHELLAIQNHGLVAFFFPRVWNNWRFDRKSAFLIIWLDRIISQGKASKPGGLYRIPHDWKEAAELRVINAPGALRLKEFEHAVRPSVTKRRARRSKVTADPAPMFDIIQQEERA